MGEVETRELDVVGVLEGVRRTLVDVRAELARGRDLGAIEHFKQVEWTAGELAEYDAGALFAGVLVVNLSSAEVYVGFAPGTGSADRGTLPLPARSWAALPYRASFVSVGGASAGEALIAPLDVAPMPAMGQLGGPGFASGSPAFVDVTDRTARVLGQVDVADEAARALGRVSVGIADSLIGSGVVVAPGVAGVIASIASGSLPAGKYEVRVMAGVSNSAVADLNNMELQRGGVDLVSPIPQGASGQSDDLVVPRVDLTGAQALEVKAIGAGTASIEYVATIVATRVE